MREIITMACTRVQAPELQHDEEPAQELERLEFSKFCRFCRKHTAHKEQVGQSE